MKIEWGVPWKTLVIALAGIALLTWGWTRDHRALGDARRSAEAAVLSMNKQIVAEQETRYDLQADVAKLMSENELVKQAYEEAMRLAPGAEVDSSARLQTEPVVVASAPRAPVTQQVYIPAGSDSDHPFPPPPCAVPLKPDGTGEFYCPGEAPPAKPAECALASGDLGSFRVDEVILRTAKENYLLVGTAEFWRERPLPRAKLAAGKFTSSLSDVSALAAQPPPRWGAEVVGLCASGGCGLGAGVLLPPVRLPLLGWRLEARAGAMAGPSLGAYGAAGARW